MRFPDEFWHCSGTTRAHHFDMSGEKEEALLRLGSKQLRALMSEHGVKRTQHKIILREVAARNDPRNQATFTHKCLRLTCTYGVARPIDAGDVRMTLHDSILGNVLGTIDDTWGCTNCSMVNSSQYPWCTMCKESRSVDSGGTFKSGPHC